MIRPQGYTVLTPKNVPRATGPGVWSVFSARDPLVMEYAGGRFLGCLFGRYSPGPGFVFGGSGGTAVVEKEHDGPFDIGKGLYWPGPGPNSL
mmetsp:Transcript_69907/g.167808  ORF Transcript_69907/g.167808 Transcript_69907/m.167808 type:complete len:92 (-) Transcript_69907:486-761(-)|eukprot:CAMPEP_0178454060 /NCGR_PEP_ID=MMETSP0689_2-20121128/45151_1 /TAXON_ID=160604 /ORGANISM="Amphidinium massartii, Strain CS-259" /LENGTH=91 /DNA_ID=CAMNT_0020079957 /DNA_START=81 /DNA_END=356 /DNA_ORIENTATION=-